MACSSSFAFSTPSALPARTTRSSRRWRRPSTRWSCSRGPASATWLARALSRSTWSEPAPTSGCVCAPAAGELTSRTQWREPLTFHFWQWSVRSRPSACAAPVAIRANGPALAGGGRGHRAQAGGEAINTFGRVSRCGALVPGDQEPSDSLSQVCRRSTTRSGLHGWKPAGLWCVSAARTRSGLMLVTTRESWWPERTAIRVPVGTLGSIRRPAVWRIFGERVRRDLRAGRTLPPGAASRPAQPSTTNPSRTATATTSITPKRSS